MEDEPSEFAVHRLVIPEPLWSFLIACEVHCTARCCEDKAFKQDPDLLIKEIDQFEKRDRSGPSLFKAAQEQLEQTLSSISRFKAETESDQILVFREELEGSFKFQLDLEVASPWFQQWREVFKRVSSTAQ